MLKKDVHLKTMLLLLLSAILSPWSSNELWSLNKSKYQLQLQLNCSKDRRWEKLAWAGRQYKNVFLIFTVAIYIYIYIYIYISIFFLKKTTFPVIIRSESEIISYKQNKQYCPLTIKKKYVEENIYLYNYKVKLRNN